MSHEQSQRVYMTVAGNFMDGSLRGGVSACIQEPFHHTLVGREAGDLSSLLERSNRVSEIGEGMVRTMCKEEVHNFELDVVDGAVEHARAV